MELFETVSIGLVPVINHNPDNGVVFTLMGEPKAKERPRFNRATGGVYTPAATKKAELEIAEAFRKETEQMFDSNVSIEMFFYTFAKTKRDLDNMVKLVLDGLNKVAYPDDYAVISITAQRYKVETVQQTRTSVTIKTNHNDHYERQTDASWQTIAQAG
jgi:Holliday junction resolvase RusA-like endonuclease